MREFDDAEEGILIHVRRIIANQYPGAKRPFAEPPIEIIEYEDSLTLFKCFGLNPRGWVWDSDFARHLFERHGRGYYSAIFWRKGTKNLNAFFRVRCFDNGFIRDKYYKPKDNQDNFNDDDCEDDETTQDIIYTKNGQIYHKNKHRGCHPYLKSLRIGVMHGYYERGEEQAQEAEPYKNPDQDKYTKRQGNTEPNWREPHYHEDNPNVPCYMDHSHDWRPEGED